MDPLNRKAFVTREGLVDLDNAGCSLNEVNRATLLYEQKNSRPTTEPSMNIYIDRSWPISEDGDQRIYVCRP